MPTQGRGHGTRPLLRTLRRHWQMARLRLMERFGNESPFF
jgi:hypothetical protein